MSPGERTGTENYSAHLLAALAALQPAERLRLYLNRRVPPSGLPEAIEPVCIPFPRLWTHARLSLEMLRRPPDLLFVPAHVVPLLHPTSVVTIHDLGYRHEPRAHTKRAYFHLDCSTRWSAWAARRIIVPSNSTASDLRRFYRVAGGKIRIIPHGVGPEFRPQPPERVVAVRNRLALPDRFILTVGTVQPRKNLARLAAALAMVADAGLPHHLVIAGKRGWLADRVERDISQTAAVARIHWRGFIDPADLPALYAAAEVVCLPSLHEGFGLPAIEAMASGTPVVVADRAALPEVVGDAGQLVDPTDSAAIARGLVDVLTNDARRIQMRAAGWERAASFTWTATAAATLAVLREAIDERH